MLVIMWCSFEVGESYQPRRRVASTFSSFFIFGVNPPCLQE